MRATGLTISTMGMVWKPGLGAAATVASIGMDFAMGLACIGSTRVMSLLGSGPMGRAMGVECTPAMMGADM